MPASRRFRGRSRDDSYDLVDNELWSSDGTSEGTVEALDCMLTRLGDSMLFTATDGERGRKLWRSDCSGSARTG